MALKRAICRSSPRTERLASSDGTLDNARSSSSTGNYGTVVVVVVVVVSGDRFHFFLEAAFLAEAAGAFAFFGLGALGFFVGTLVVFLAFEGLLGFAAFFADAAGVAGAAAEDAEPAAAFFPLPPAAAAADFFSPDFLAAFGFFAAGDLAFPPEEARFFEAAGLAAERDFSGEPPPDAPDALPASLNDPDAPFAPFPFGRTRAPDSTADLRYFLMNGDSFSASTL